MQIGFPVSLGGSGSCQANEKRRFRTGSRVTKSNSDLTRNESSRYDHMAALFGPPALWTASAHGRIEEVRLLLADGPLDIEEKGGLREASPLNAACMQGHLEVCRLLLEAGAEASAKDNEETAPLHWAAIHGRDALARLLLHHGADVLGRDKLGRSALYMAAWHGREGVTRLLLDKGADVHSKSDVGYTPEDVTSHPAIAALLKAVAARRARCEAFAMGQQERLGAGSLVRGLEPEVVRMVLKPTVNPVLGGLQ